MNSTQAKPKHEVVSLAQAAAGLVMLSLVLLGLTGTLYKLVSPGGWIALVLGRSLGSSGAAVGSLLLLVACALYTGSAAIRRHFLSELVVYGFAGVGALYLTRFLLQGSF